MRAEENQTSGLLKNNDSHYSKQTEPAKAANFNYSFACLLFSEPGRFLLGGPRLRSGLGPACGPRVPYSGASKAAASTASPLTRRGPPPRWAKPSARIRR